MEKTTAKRIPGTDSFWEYNGIDIKHLKTIKSNYKWWVLMTPHTYKFKTQKEAVTFIKLETGK